MEFTREWASIAQTLIDECLDQAKRGLIHSLLSRNRKRFEYWMPRLLHLMKESDWIEGIIKKLEAAADETNRPPKE